MPVRFPFCSWGRSLGRGAAPVLVLFLGSAAGGAEATTVPAQGSVLGRARALLARDRTEEALSLLRREAQKGGTEAPELWCELGETLRGLNRHEEALGAYNEVIRLRPRVELLKRALRRKYQIGLDFLKGIATRSFLGLFSYSSPSYGVQVLDELVRDFPFEEFSDDALWSIANYYFRNAEWEEARPVYERLVDSYPRSEWVPPAYFQLGKVLWHAIKGYKYDPTAMRRCRWYFERFLEKQRMGPEAAEARRFVGRLRDMEARYELYVASFYLLNDCPAGARIHLRAAVRKGRLADGSLSPAAKEARQRLNELLKSSEHAGQEG